MSARPETDSPVTERSCRERHQTTYRWLTLLITLFLGTLSAVGYAAVAAHNAGQRIAVQEARHEDFRADVTRELQRLNQTQERILQLLVEQKRSP